MYYVIYWKPAVFRNYVIDVDRCNDERQAAMIAKRRLSEGYNVKVTKEVSLSIKI
jgi:hypothetical protein